MTERDEDDLCMFNLCAVKPKRYKKIVRYWYKHPRYFIYLLDILSTKVIELFIKIRVYHEDNDLLEKAGFLGRIDAMSPYYARFVLHVSDATEAGRQNFRMFKKPKLLTININ